MDVFLSELLSEERKAVEFKEQYSKSILKTVSAFANYHDGLLVVGVSDSGQIIGIDDPKTMRLNIENAINDSVKPRPFYEVETKNVHNRTILIFSVYKGEYTPYTVDRKAYRRTETSTVEVERHEYDELVLLGRHQSYEELPYEDSELKFGNLGVWLSSRLNIASATSDVLKSLELIRDGKYTNAAALLADKNKFDEVGLDLILYKDYGLTEIIDRVSLVGVSVIEHFEKSISFYEKHINRGDIIKSAIRETYEEIPLIAFREAVANAIVHRDYSRKGHNRIEFFEDRVEIASIGGLPIGITKDEFLRGSFSNVRNRIISDIFFRCRYIEKMGTGIRRIKEAYAQYAVKPIFEIMENSIIITLPKIQAPFQTSGNSEGSIKLNNEEEKALNYIKSTSGLVRSELEQYMGVKRTKANLLLKSLIEHGQIVSIGKGRDTKYRLK